MARLSNKLIWAEMARRKVRFHKDVEWDTIKLWGLFNWGDVSRLFKSGKLINTYNYKKENKIIWVAPSRETWEKHIKPLIDKYSLDELEEMTGLYSDY